MLRFGVLAILFFKFIVRLTKLTRRHAWSTVKNLLISPVPPIPTENTEKTFAWNFLYLIGIYFFVLWAVNFADVSSTYNSPRFKLSVIFLIGLLPSNFAKISLCFFNDVWNYSPFSDALCWLISWDTKRFFTLFTRGIKPCIIGKIFREYFPERNFFQKSGEQN